MAAMGPFEPAPPLAVAVSGGADSLALTLLADAWARARGGQAIGLIVDHGLRPESAAEARETARRLGERGIPARILVLDGLTAGPALAERARDARYAALVAACAASGTLHLLLGHHAADQAETVAHRVLRGSGAGGLAGMAAVVELSTVRLLRPLLSVMPEALRDYLRAAGVAWVEDPSNRDQRALRPRMRAGLATHDRGAIEDLGDAARVAGQARCADEQRTARVLGREVAIRPEGFALVPPGRVSVSGLRSVIRMVAGAAYPPPAEAVASMVAMPRPATLAGVRLLTAGRLGPGMLAVREPAAMGPAVPARAGAVWDGRFRLDRASGLPGGGMLGALGDDAARFRGQDCLPTAVLRTLPALRMDGVLVAVPHLRYSDPAFGARVGVTFAPPHPACGAWFHATVSVPLA